MANDVAEAWRANARVNRELLNHLTEEMLGAQTPGGGYSVAQHLAHMTEVMKSWGFKLDEQLNALPDLYSDYDEVADTFVAETDLTRIRDVMVETEEALLKAVEESEGEKGTLPHTSTGAFLIHMMVHDAHHRGQILLALKTSGHPLPDEDRLWGPWRGE